jgi:hypothetical protein
VLRSVQMQLFNRYFIHRDESCRCLCVFVRRFTWAAQTDYVAKSGCPHKLLEGVSSAWKWCGNWEYNFTLPRGVWNPGRWRAVATIPCHVGRDGWSSWHWRVENLSLKCSMARSNEHKIILAHLTAKTTVCSWIYLQLYFGNKAGLPLKK